ncbi:hypothetical protein K7432_001854 [Basidiobolus ranarum]|uniref:Uncharacterized protein n=1 Tax=Basidiobolus ranarum TaxID=34480 RepID=A0ABR2X2E5_9FUNG
MSSSTQMLRGIVITLSLSWFTWSSPVLNIDPGLSLKSNPVLNFSPELSPEFKGLCIVSSECERIHRPRPINWNADLSGLENAIGYLTSRLAPPYRGPLLPPPGYNPPRPPIFSGAAFRSLPQGMIPPQILGADPRLGQAFNPSFQQLGFPGQANLNSDFVRQLLQNPEALQLLQSAPDMARTGNEDNELLRLLEGVDLQELLGERAESPLERLEKEPALLDLLKVLDSGLEENKKPNSKNKKS